MTDKELDRLEALAALAGPLQAKDDEGSRVVCDGHFILLRSTVPRDDVDRPFLARVDAAADLAVAAPALVAEVRRQRADLTRTEDEARTALDALHARIDAAERAAETARVEEREACAVALDHLAAGVMWHEIGDRRADATARREGEMRRRCYEYAARAIRARGGDRG